MQGPCVAADDACGALQKCHQFAEIATVQEGGGIAACTNQRCRQIVVTRSKINDTAQPLRFSQLPTQSSEALGRPAFGAPAGTWAQDHVAIKALCPPAGTQLGSGLV